MKKENKGYALLPENTKLEFEKICANDKLGALDPVGFYNRIVNSHTKGNCSVATLSEIYSLDKEMIKSIILSSAQAEN